MKIYEILLRLNCFAAFFIASNAWMGIRIQPIIIHKLQNYRPGV
jgi:hypothetical protein